MNGPARYNTVIGIQQQLLIAWYLILFVAASALGQTTSSPRIVQEQEPNDSILQANLLRLGEVTKGTIDPLGEADYFRFSVPDRSRAMLTVRLFGEPHIRTSIELLDPSGAVRKVFDPGRWPAKHDTISWRLPRSDNLIRITQPRTSIVLIWDTSGSMEDSIGDLRRAVISYLEDVRPSERFNLIQFASQVNVLLPNFTSDRAELLRVSRNRFTAGGGTRLFDAIERGVQLLQPYDGNRAIVVMTDGNDDDAELFEPFLDRIRNNPIRMYTVGLGSVNQPVLESIALATNGRTFYTPNSQELSRLYQTIADEQKSTSTYYLAPTLSRSSGFLQVVSLGGGLPMPEEIEILIDASRSMWGQFQGRSKIDIAKEAAMQVLERLPDNARVGLRVFGHRVLPRRAGACSDSYLMFPVKQNRKIRLLGQILQLRPFGQTPISFALRRAAEDFGVGPEEKTVILFTDGEEECKGDTPAAVAELHAMGIEVRVNVIALPIAPERTRREMNQVAQLTGPLYFDTENSGILPLRHSTPSYTSYEVLDAAGERIESGMTGTGRVELLEGVYDLRILGNGRPIPIRKVAILPNVVTRVDLKQRKDDILIAVDVPGRPSKRSAAKK
ncbi:VWA domain-containing protein [bacterium]|nr:VWA domain-containing protein [bacterium]